MDSELNQVGDDYNEGKLMKGQLKFHILREKYMARQRQI